MTGRGFGCTPNQISRAEFVFANNRINHSQDKQKTLRAKIGLQGLMKTNGDIAPRKPEGLSTARAQGTNRKAVANYFIRYQNRCTELNIQDKPQLIFNLDETGFLLNKIPPKIIATKGATEVKFTSVERDDIVITVACRSANGVLFSSS
jgi:hypothetical protein